MVEQVEMRREIVKPQRGAHGGLIIRIPKISARDLLMDWNAWKQLFDRTNLDDWLLGNLDIDVSQIQVLADNGLGGSGKCPVHGYQHLQIFPVDGEPMQCSKAVLKEK